MKAGPRDSWGLPTMPGMPGGIRLYRETVLTEAGLSAKLTVYPATIVQARYGGSYEGAPWLCFPVHVQRFAEPEWHHWDGDEIECGQFWRHSQGEGWLIGLGKTPTDAYNDLIGQVCARLGLDRAALTGAPACDERSTDPSPENWRQADDGPASEAPDPARDDVAAGADSAGTPLEAPDPAQDGGSQGLSHIARIKAFARRGLTATTAVLALLGAAGTAYAVWVRPDTAFPQPQQSDVYIDFNRHPATSLITAAITLESYPAFYNGIVLDIELTGADLAHTDWSITMDIPTGVQLKTPQSGWVFPNPDSKTQDTVILNPGPQANQKYSAVLFWNDLYSGPLQIHGANLAAWLPNVQVDNYYSGNSGGAPSVPEPQLSVTRQLLPPGGYTYFGGQSPDQTNVFGVLALAGNQFGWRWNAAKPIPFKPKNGEVISFSQGVYVEGRSAAADEQSTNAVFWSGIAFGVAAAAIIAAIQEFVKSATDRERPRPESVGPAPRA